MIKLDISNVKLNFSQSELVELGMKIAEGRVDSQHIKKWIIKHKK